MSPGRGRGGACLVLSCLARLGLELRRCALSRSVLVLGAFVRPAGSLERLCAATAAAAVAPPGRRAKVRRTRYVELFINTCSRGQFTRAWCAPPRSCVRACACVHSLWDPSCGDGVFRCAAEPDLVVALLLLLDSVFSRRVGFLRRHAHSWVRSIYLP